MDKVSFVIVRADQEGLCGATVNAGMERRLCIREGCAVHKAEDGRAERELSFDHMYLLAPVSNNKLVVIPFPRLDLEGLDEVTKSWLPGRPAVDRADGISIMSLLSLERTEGRLWDVYYQEKLWWRYFQGQMDDTLTSLGMASPRMKATSSGSGAFDFSTAMSNQELEKEDEMLFKVEGSKRKSAKIEPGFDAETVESREQTRQVSDKHEDDAMLEYDPQQMMFVLQRLKELSDNLSLLHTNLPNMEASIGRNIDDICKKVADLETQFRDTGPHPKVEEKMRAVDAEMARLSGRLSSLVSEGGLQHAAMEDRVGRVEHALSDPEQLPSVVMKVKELLRTVNGDAGGPPGAGIDARFHASRRNNPAAGTMSSFNLSMGTGNSTNSSTVSQQEEISELRSECAWLRERVEELMRIPQRGRFEQGTRATPSVEIVNVVQRLAILEDRQEAGSISMGGIKFSSERDCMAFVSEHLTDPNFGLLTDMVSLLQKIQTRIPTNESVISEHYKAGQVKLDKIEAGVIASYSVTMPNVFNKSTEDILSSHNHPIPQCKTYKEWSSPNNGLREKIARELLNEMTSATSRIQALQLNVTARSVFSEMLTSSREQWNATAQWLDTSYQTNTSVYSLSADEAYSLAGKGLRAVFLQLRERRVAAQDVMTASTAKSVQFARAMWASLQAHVLMAEYQQAGYIGHPTMAAVNTEHLLTNRAAPDQLKKLNDRVTSLAANAELVWTDVDALASKAGLTSKARGKRRQV